MNRCFFLLFLLVVSADRGVIALRDVASGTRGDLYESSTLNHTLACTEKEFYNAIALHEAGPEAKALTDTLYYGVGLLRDKAWGATAHAAKTATQFASNSGMAVHYAPKESLLRKFGDKVFPWYLKHYGTTTDRLAYAAGCAHRFVQENAGPIAVVAGAVVAGLVYYWWSRTPPKATTDQEKEKMEQMEAMNEEVLNAIPEKSDGEKKYETLIALQATLLKAAKENKCTLRGVTYFKSPGSFMYYPMFASLADRVLQVSRGTFTKILTNEMGQGSLETFANLQLVDAKLQYPMLAPLAATCGNKVVDNLDWYSVQGLLEQLGYLESPLEEVLEEES